MYAAAAGASLGSRQARKQQRLQNTKNAAALQQTLKDKLAATKELRAPTKSRQFHQLPAGYLRTPTAAAAATGHLRKPSFGGGGGGGHQSTSNSRLLLPITEMSSVASSTRNIHLQFEQQHLHHRGHSKSPHHSRHASFNHKSRSHLSGSASTSASRDHHHHASSRQLPSSRPHHPHYHLNLNPECAVHGSCSQLLGPNQRLNRSATATLPLNNLHQTPPSTPFASSRHHPKHRHLDPRIASNSQLLTPLLDSHSHHHHAQHRNSFSTLHLANLLPHDGGHAAAAGQGPLSRRTSEVDFKRAGGGFHHIEPIIITPATPLPSPHRHHQQEGIGSEAAAGGGGEEGAAAASSNVLLIDLRPSTPHNKSTDNLSRCESPIEPPQIERKCSVYRPRPGPEQKYYYYDDESKLNEDETYYDNYSRTIRYELDPNGVHRVIDNGEPCSYDLMVPAMAHEPGNSWISPDYLSETLARGGAGRKQSTSICTCDHVECAQGKAAWLERGRRCSVPDNNASASCHRRWVKRNRIHDSSLGGSSDEEDFLGVLRGPSSFANAFLYVGLGTVAIGLVISFVGTGEKGFKTVELRLIGPSLIGIGLICCILRILFCICPSSCITGRKLRNKKTNKVDADYTTSLLRSDQSTASNGRESGGAGGERGNSIKRVQIARGPNSMQKFPTTHSSQRLKPCSKTMEGMEALRQIAQTSLFIQEGRQLDAKELQSELQLQQSTSSGGGGVGRAFTSRSSSNNSIKRKGNNRVVPIIQEPASILDDHEDVRRFDAVSVDIFNLSDGDDEDDDEDLLTTSNSISDTVIHRIPGATAALQQTVSSACETTTKTSLLSTVNERNHKEVEPGGGGGRTVTAVAEVAPPNNNHFRTTTNNWTGVESSGSKSRDAVNKLSRDRAPVNLGTLGTTTLLDAVLIETSLSEPISPSFTINLPNIVPMSPPPPLNFSISDNKNVTPQKRPNPNSSSSSFPFPPNFAIPGPSTVSFQSTSSSAGLPNSSSSFNKFSFPGTSSQQQQKSSSSNSKPSGGGGGGTTSSGELLELVLSPSKLGQ